MTPIIEKASEAPAVGEGQSKADKKPVKKSEKSKKVRPRRLRKKKAAEAPPVAEGQAAPKK
jgi:hypothetical protein